MAYRGFDLYDSGQRELRGCIEQYLGQRGLPLRGAFRCLNPVHPDVNPSMSYNRQAENVHCFSCGASYDVFDLIGLEYGLDHFPDKLLKVRELFGVRAPAKAARQGGGAGALASAPAIPGDDACKALRAESTGELSYFEGRGITRESCEKYGLFQAGGRAYFPILDKQGTCIGWQGRAISDKARPKYKNAPGPMGIWNVQALESKQPVFVTEGIIDAICLEQLGHNALALCGSQNTGKLIAAIGSGKPLIVICPDPDRAGDKMRTDLEAALKQQGIPHAHLRLSEQDGDIAALYVSDRSRLQLTMDNVQLTMNVSAARTDLETRCRDDSVMPSASEQETARAPGQLTMNVCAARTDLKTVSSPVSRSIAESDYLNAFFAYANARRGRVVPATGIAQLDSVLDGGLHPGLYVLGAVSSVGKTSFALQIADHIAEAGGRVLFFSLEQSRFELMAKSLSRISAKIGGKRDALTPRQLLSGRATQGGLLTKTTDQYREISSRLQIIESIGEIGVEDIRRQLTNQLTIDNGQLTMNESAARTDLEAVSPPVSKSIAEGDTNIVNCSLLPVNCIIVDYLQILRPCDPRATDKQNTDRAVLELKRISRDFDIPVIAISSFNRENYKAQASMEAFKESGAVEYSSDVLLGLQLAGVGTREFDINKAKSRNPRKVELVMLKNRTGVPWANIPLEYDARVGLFG